MTHKRNNPSLYRALVVGELMLDTTVPVQVPTTARSLLRRSEPLVYEQRAGEKTTLGGLFYIGRFLRHFAQVELVFPLRKGGLCGHKYPNLVRELEKENLKIHAVDSTGDCYNATRYLESADSLLSARPDFLERRGILRIDSGTIGKLDADDSNHILGKLKSVLRNWPEPDRRACVVLADYDLGVFSRKLVEDIKELLPPDVPVVIYTGRTWRQYADWAGATLVADTNEAIADLMLMEGMDDELAVEDSPFPHIATRFPELGGIVLVDRRQTRVGEWHCDRNEGLITGKVAALDLLKPYARTPIGHRALVAACLALARMKDSSLSAWPRVAHYAAEGSNDDILIGDIDQARVQRVRSAFADPRPLSRLPKCEIESVVCSPADLLRSQILQRGGYFPFDSARTEIPEIFTTHAAFRDDLNRFVVQIEHRDLPESTIDAEKLVIQKLLVLGSSGVGKSFIAKKLAAKIAPQEGNLLLSFVGKDAPTKAESMAALIRQSVAAPARRVLVLDEVDKHQNGRKLHHQLLTLFDDDERNRLRNWRPVLVIAACSRDMKKLTSNDQHNHRDFYTRFSARLAVPPLDQRPLDAVHACASILRTSGVRLVSLAGLCAIAEKKYANLRDVRKIATALSQHNHTKRLDSAAFAAVGLKLPSGLGRDRDVVLEPTR